MTQRRYQDELTSDFQRRLWPVVDVEARLMRAARAADAARAAQRAQRQRRSA